jgi:hypothetical protein
MGQGVRMRERRESLCACVHTLATKPPPYSTVALPQARYGSTLLRHSADVDSQTGRKNPLVGQKETEERLKKKEIELKQDSR